MTKEISVPSVETHFTVTQLFQLGGKVTAFTFQVYHSALALGKKKTSRAQNEGKTENCVSVEEANDSNVARSIIFSSLLSTEWKANSDCQLYH